MKATLAFSIYAATLVAALGADPFERAANYALTGSDNQSVTVLDRKRCTFRALSSEGYKDFFLNEVDFSRFKIASFRNALGIRYEVSLAGENVIVSGESRIIAPGIGTFGGPFQQRNYTIGFAPADQIDPVRLMRAWRYLRGHGCSGSQSSF